MMSIERWIHRGYFAEADDRGDDLPGGGTDETVDEDVKADEKGQKDEAEEKKEKDEEQEVEKPAKPEPSIPKSRFDAAVAKARKAQEAAEAKAAEMEQRLAAQAGSVDEAKVEEKLLELEEDLEKAIADGNVEKKVQLRKDIRLLNLQLAESRAALHAQRATAVAIEQVRYDALVERMEVEHPELNPDNSGEYDEDIVAELLEYKEAFEAKGLSSSNALKKALKAVYPAGKAKEEEKVEPKDDKGGERKAKAVEKALEAKRNQPPDARKAGMDSDKAGKTNSAADIVKMKDEEFAKLTKEQLKRLRGDDF